MARWRSAVVAVCFGMSAVAAQELIYVTDIEIYTSMARCAKSAVSNNVMGMTNSQCGEAVTELQSCVCTKNGGANSAAVSKGISRSISYSCGATASDDLSSAILLLNGYCDQANIGTFPTPTSPVQAYITDLPAVQDLPACAASGLSYAVMSMTYELCPEDPSLLQSCVCSKNQNSLRVSQLINTSIKYSCSPITADISAAQGIFAGYCGLGAGVTSFPVASPPPGDITYYVTALPEYSSLAPCAQSGLSYGVLAHTRDRCPEDPAGLGSCVCLKTGMPNIVSSMITSSVKYSCDSTATDDVSSALSVWDYYCAAVRAEVTPGGVTESVPTTANTGSLGGFGGSGPSQTASTSSDGNPFGGLGLPGDPSYNSAGEERKPNIGAIVGGVLGGVVAIVLIGVAIIFWVRRRRMNASNQAVSAMAPSNPNPGASAATAVGGKGELDGTATAVRPATSGSLDQSKTTTAASGGSISPMSANHTSELNGKGPYAPPPPPMPELPTQYAHAPHQHPQSELHGQDRRPELYGQQAFRPELQGGQDVHQTFYSSSSVVFPQSPSGPNGWEQHMHEAPASYPGQHPQGAELNGQPQYYEMPGGGPASYARQ